MKMGYFNSEKEKLASTQSRLFLYSIDDPYKYWFSYGLQIVLYNDVSSYNVIGFLVINLLKKMYL